ncbi:PhzF family phenazine biosynthesis protein [Cohnella lupini]|uniref:PhzF family phenazine biosynthesis protein n=1 Tax=Cohnella lupini TaxID=1294267 RepID=A0A3D9HZT7_9BACL|nr:PhzF family phenazine biosynthesis protein [Cohnella lupini]RED54910.1 PhzF family phenazine biosynthesis protein [Cohnella lupini]
MKQLEIYHIDAFTDVSFGGNPAGVIPEAGSLTTEEMQKIAGELNLPESVFLLPPSRPDADYRVRYFTPTEEINFCGHATVALSWLLAEKYGYLEKGDRVALETNVGLVPVEWIIENNRLARVSMTQLPPRTQEIDISIERVAELVGIHPGDVDDRYPIRLGSTGNWHLFVPVRTRSAIDSATPQLKELGRMNKELQVSTTHLFTFDMHGEFDLYTRDFAPAIGIAEDPVTGAANGALAGYLYLEGILPEMEQTRLKVGQGHAIGRPGTLYITVTPQETAPRIEVAGSAVITIEGLITIR